MTLEEALTQLGSRINPSVHALLKRRETGNLRASVRRVGTKKSDEDEMKTLMEGIVGKALNTLNEMYEETESSLELEEFDCNNYITDVTEQLTTTVREIGENEAMLSNAKAKNAASTAILADTEVKVKNTEGEEQEHHEYCTSTIRATEAQVKILEADHAVAKYIVTMTQCDDSGDGAVQLDLVQCTTGDHGAKYELHPAHNATAEFAKLTSPAARAAVRRAIKTSMNLALGKDAYGKSDGDEEEEGALDVPEETSWTDAAEGEEKQSATSDAPDDKKAGAKCTVSDSPMCPKIADAMSTMAGEIETVLVEQTGILAKLRQNCSDLTKEFENTLEEYATTIGDGNVKLAEAKEEETTSTGNLRLKNTQKTDLTMDLEDKTESCHKTKEEAEATMCAIQVVREEMVNMNGNGARPIMRDCKVGDWLPQDCSVSCGGGTQMLRREVIVDPFYGAACPPLEMQKPCNEHPCPVDCVMSEWSTWGECSAECGEGLQERIRNIEVPMDHGGQPCEAVQESRSCKLGDCDVDCELGPWSGFKGCSKVCDTGFKQNTRSVVTPKKGDGVCWDDRDPMRLVEEKCNEMPCPAFLVCESKLDLIILMDGSGSIGQRGFESEKVFVNSLLDRVAISDDGVRVGLVLFSRTITTLSPLSSDVASLKAAVSGASWPRSTTNTAGALNQAQDLLRAGRKDAESVVFIITDGMPNSDTNTAIASAAVRASTRLVFVPVGPYLDMDRVNSWASQPPRDNVLALADLASATDFLSTMIADLCPLARAYCPVPFKLAGGAMPDSTANLMDDVSFASTMGNIGGAFTFGATVRMDERARWGRIFDFGGGKKSDNIIATSVSRSSDLGIYIYNGKRAVAKVYVPSFFAEGVTFDFLVSISLDGIVKVYKDSVLVHEQNTRKTPLPVSRSNMFIGKSNWAQDQPWIGEITNVRVWNDEIGPDCEHGGEVYTPEAAEGEAM